MIDEGSFLKYIAGTTKRINELPTEEIKYYLHLLVNSIKVQNNEKTHAFLKGLLELISSLQDLSIASGDDISKNTNQFDLIFDRYRCLCEIAQTRDLSYRIKINLFNLGSVILGTVCGIFGGIIGGLAGFSRGLWNLAPFRGFSSGVLLGAFAGGAFGYRLPKKLFKDEMTRQLKFALDGVERCLDVAGAEIGHSRFLNEKIKPLSKYREEVIAEIRGLFSSEAEFDSFLKSDTNYSIRTYVATFIGEPLLQGYVGHHAYIKIDIKAQTKLIEFNNEAADTNDNIVTQCDTRTVKGSVLIDMLAYHRKLQETHAATAQFVLTRMKPGEVDCYSYVNKVLISTNQEPTCVKRYKDMTAIGKLMGDFYEYVSPFAPGFFQTLKKKPVDDNGVDPQVAPTRA